MTDIPSVIQKLTAQETESQLGNIEVGSYRLLTTVQFEENYKVEVEWTIPAAKPFEGTYKVVTSLPCSTHYEYLLEKVNL